MDDCNIRRFERATYVQAFGRDNAADFAAGNKATELFAELDSIVFKLTIARVGLLRSPVGKATLIDALSIEFKAIARTARAIEIDELDFDDTPYHRPITIETLVTIHADSLLTLLEDDNRPVADGGNNPAQLTAKAALRAKFIAYELPAGFVEDLRAVRDALDLCNSDKDSEAVESTSAIDTLLGNAQAIITRLDAVIQNKYSRDPDKLAAWKSASRTELAAKEEEFPVTTPRAA